MRLHVGQGLTSRSRLDYAVEKMTEVGAALARAAAGLRRPRHRRARRRPDRALGARRPGAAAAQCAAACMSRASTPPATPAPGLDALPAGCPTVLLSPTAERRLAACDFKELLGERPRPGGAGGAQGGPERRGGGVLPRAAAACR